ncbi:MAG: UDP-N-acetylglucosamine 1-carboxyvinyltransferase [bacterium]|nr:UDP-N-acetylglucosamine 1-carboxyvinyltransferase [bacterium]
MARFIVEGGAPLSGRIKPSGNKNEALPVIAASLLSKRPVELSNTPGIGDVKSMLNLVGECGARVEQISAHTVLIDASIIERTEPPQELSRRIRGSILLVGPLLARCGRARMAFPGGDRIGRRRIDTHLKGFEALGAKFRYSEDEYEVWAPGRLKGADILLDEASVTATENLVMAAALAEGVTVIHNAACEPHVQQLCAFLNTLGARITGVGSNVLRIEGVDELSGGSHRIAADYLEVGSFIGLAAVTGGELLIEDAGPVYLRMVLHQFENLGIHVEIRGDDIVVPASQPKKIKPDIHTQYVKIDDGPWPAFPADMMSIAVIIATQTAGTVMIFEKMFESRLFFVDKLIAMGANIILCDPHRAVVVGPTPLRGQTMSSPDIRAGMALLTAALCAEGTSEIQNIEQIDRGYERLDERLTTLGARIQRVD